MYYVNALLTIFSEPRIENQKERDCQGSWINAINYRWNITSIIWLIISAQHHSDINFALLN